MAFDVTLSYVNDPLGSHINSFSECAPFIGVVHIHVYQSPIEINSIINDLRIYLGFKSLFGIGFHLRSQFFGPLFGNKI